MSSSPENPWPWKEPPTIGQRGAFIVIEGLDRAGKTTQVQRLCDKLYSQGHNIKTLRFPGNTNISIVEKFEVFDHSSSSSSPQTKS
jgi:dTMP kinase